MGPQRYVASKDAVVATAVIGSVMRCRDGYGVVVRLEKLGVSGRRIGVGGLRRAADGYAGRQRTGVEIRFAIMQLVPASHMRRRGLWRARLSRETGRRRGWGEGAGDGRERGGGLSVWLVVGRSQEPQKPSAPPPTPTDDSDAKRDRSNLKLEEKR